jgi:dnd system-associated protein 4
VAEISIDRSKRHTDLLNVLTSAGSQFGTMRDALLFAAGLGYSIQRQEELGDTHSDSIRISVFQNKPLAIDLISMLAAVVSGDPEIVLDKNFDKSVGIFSRYAAGGLDHIAERAGTKLSDADEVVRTILNEHLMQASKR